MTFFPAVKSEKSIKTDIKSPVGELAMMKGLLDGIQGLIGGGNRLNSRIVVDS